MPTAWAVNCLPDSGAMRSAQKKEPARGCEREWTECFVDRAGRDARRAGHPVIVLNDVAHAVPMARALVEGGIRMLEVTLRTPQALACMEAIARDVPEAVVGAGTVRARGRCPGRRTCRRPLCREPRLHPAVGRACRDLNLPLLPAWRPAAKS